MGFYIRKQKRLKLINLNLSKSGVGVSTGVTGGRLVFSPKGTYVHLGRHGFYYKKKISNLEESKESIQQNEEYLNNSYSNSENNIKTVNFDNLTDIDSEEFIKELNEKDNKIKAIHILLPYLFIALVTLLGYIFIYPVSNIEEVSFATINSKVVNLREQPSTQSKIIHKAKIGEKFRIIETKGNWIEITAKNEKNAFVYSSLVTQSHETDYSQSTNLYKTNNDLSIILLVIYLIVIITCVISSKILDRKRKTIELYYNLDDEQNEKYNKFIEGFKSFSEVAKIWKINESQSGVDIKYNAGADTLFNKTEVENIFLHRPPMKHFMTNIYVPYIGLSNIELFFFPERLLIKQCNKYAAISYSNLNIESNTILFRENEPVPNDADIIDYTWRFLNKSGGPDRRFSNNVKIPICSYTKYRFHSTKGLNEAILTSKNGGMDSFIESLLNIAEKQNSNNDVDENIDKGSKYFLFKTSKLISILNRKNGINEDGSNTVLRIIEEFFHSGQTFSVTDIKEFLNYDTTDAEAVMERLHQLHNALSYENNNGNKDMELFYTPLENFVIKTAIFSLTKKSIVTLDIQRQCEVGYNYASTIKDKLVELEIIGELNKSEEYPVLVKDRLELDKRLKKMG